MESGTSVARLDFDSEERFQRLRKELGVSTLGLNLMLLQPGQRGRIHRHKTQEEVYVVLEGELTLLVEGDEQTIAAGEAVRVGPEVRRQLVNTGGTRLAILALGGANEHVGRDGEAFADWANTEGAPPQEIPLPADIAPGERG